MFSGQIELYRKLLIQWNATCNLIQTNSLDHFLERHVNDSLKLINFLHKNDYIVDIGSGGGLPGIVLAIYGFKNIVLAEKSYKKARFLQMACNKLKLNCKIFNDDINNFPAKNYIAVSRAFGSLEKLVGIMKRIHSTVGFFHKGKTYPMEINEALNKHNFDYKILGNEKGKQGAIIFVQGNWE